MNYFRIKLKEIVNVKRDDDYELFEDETLTEDEKNGYINLTFLVLESFDYEWGYEKNIRGENKEITCHKYWCTVKEKQRLKALINEISILWCFEDNYESIREIYTLSEWAERTSLDKKQARFSGLEGEKYNFEPNVELSTDREWKSNMNLNSDKPINLSPLEIKNSTKKIDRLNKESKLLDKQNLGKRVMRHWVYLKEELMPRITRAKELKKELVAIKDKFWQSNNAVFNTKLALESGFDKELTKRLIKVLEIDTF